MNRDEWMMQFRLRLEERGVPPMVATDIADTITFVGPFAHSLEEDPAEVADEEIEQMTDDEVQNGN
jgi:hypothetical protein